ncbi:hypothetical protein ACIGXC_39045 [Streptomyces paradoxus]|uniref:hypothetical protein n=1 Tax=Streptomyces paradoxus TaxID=66375 RepID=UPI0037D9771A
MMKRFPLVEITLPWKVAAGPPVTKRLSFTGPRGCQVWRTSINDPGLSLRVYAHLMPSRRRCTLKAVAAVFEGAYAPVR